ncbi:Matrix metalloproteinase-21 [Holothuria leucospilota]|uniref:Matrix metalloproteinase-21 n=1 Tax=Holothuria leucospilota TaxID=206669 RepID=A0A9Q0YQN6_HOLLE|nr:Matrix metalloproteinase-21 [Holothuria leucospilota]
MNSLCSALFTLVLATVVVPSLSRPAAPKLDENLPVSGGDDVPRENEKINTTLEISTKAKKFLKDYGYVASESKDQSLTEASLLSLRRLTPPPFLSDTSGTLAKATDEPLLADNLPKLQDAKSLTEKDTALTKAIRLFQERFHLPITGFLDQSTVELIRKPRCGIPDNSLLHQESSEGRGIVLGEEVKKIVDMKFEKVDYLQSTENLSGINSGKDLNKDTIPYRSEPVTSKSDTAKPVDIDNFDYRTSFPFWDSIEEDIWSSLNDFDAVIEEASFSENEEGFDFTGELEEDTLAGTLAPLEDFSTEVVTDIVTTVVDGIFDSFSVNDNADDNEIAPSFATTHSVEPGTTSVSEKILSRLSPQDRRKKRSVSSSSLPGPEEVGLNVRFTTTPVKWRLLSVYCSRHFSSCSGSREVLELAFLKWAGVTPLTFQEQRTGDLLDVDIQIAFLTRESSLDFNINLHEDEYARYQVSADGTYLFFQDDIQWTHQSSYGYNLLSVAVHEIGHILGLSHSDVTDSTMYPFYQPYNGRVVIDSVSRQLVQSYYGTCTGSFDVAFDWVRTSNNGRKTVYSSYFMRGKWAWLYDNSNQRPRNGVPRAISSAFSGVPSNLDVVVQIRPKRNGNHGLGDNRKDLYFFKGSRYWRLNHNDAQVYETDPDTGVYYGSSGRLIRDGWPALPGQTVRIPDNLDAAYFDQRDNNVYFFKGSLVYAYDVENGGCCSPGYPRQISEAYPSRYNSHGPLPDNIDVAYYSIKNRALYFFKGEDYWENQTYNPSLSTVENKVGPSAKWNTKWKDICDVE